MNLKLFIIFIFLSILISSFSCSNKPNRSRKPVVQIGIESGQKKITFGDDIRLNIAVKLKDGELKLTKIFVDSVLLTSSEKSEFTFTLNKFENLGIHTIKAQSVKTDGTEGVYFKTFEVLSDVVPENYGYEIVQAYSHNETSFTEGLEINNGFIYESTGENGKSMLYKINLKTGKIIQSVKLADKYFGEGITILNDKIFQLTYKTKIGFVYQLENMALIDSFYFESAEGWGMTNDKQNLIMSDGTNIITYLDPVSLKTVKKIQVYDNQNATVYINELEYSEGFIYANLWTTNLIVKIDPKTGKVLSKIDLDGILTMTNPDTPVDELNGIAIDPLTKKMYVTGKFYPKLFEIKPVKKE
jgi:glutaminyl-peptide cyclotransferase